MRNPNGYGSVVKLSGNRRKPFAVRKVESWNEKGHPVYMVIGYFETREDGMIALAEYNKNPYDVKSKGITLAELYEECKDKKLTKFSKSTKQGFASAYQHMKTLWGMKYVEIRSFHMQKCIDDCGRGYGTQSTIKTLFSHLDKFALEIDTINKGYAQLTTTAQATESEKTPFSDTEILALWEHQNEPFVDTVLIYLYTGFRLSELLEMKTSNIDLVNRTFKGGLKTSNGKDRIVPIHDKVFHLVENRFDESNQYFLERKNKRFNTGSYYNVWEQIMNRFQMNHTPHECRHTFRTKLDRVNANKKCIDMIMGHKSNDIGLRVYTHKTIEELRETVNLIE